MGERVEHADIETHYGATLRGPITAVALTLIRSMHVHSFEINIAGHTITQRCEEVER